MIRPARFAMNVQTALDNHFQDQNSGIDDAASQEAALAEFDGFVKGLREAGVHVDVLQDTEEPHTPDSIFPNNWISMHADGSIRIYPMKTVNRQQERRVNIQNELSELGYAVDRIHDWTHHERQGRILEGTGSIIFDHPSQTAFCAISQRAEWALFTSYCEEFGYTPITFHAHQDTPQGRQAIYHTNVMMCIADRYAIICLDCIDDPKERQHVRAELESIGKQVIEISEAQTAQFAGNMLQVIGARGPLLVMSESAYQSLSDTQIQVIESHNPILHAKLDTIEQLGGGSARCMMAENFLPLA